MNTFVRLSTEPNQCNYTVQRRKQTNKQNICVFVLVGLGQITGWGFLSKPAFWKNGRWLWLRCERYWGNTLSQHNQQQSLGGLLQVVVSARQQTSRHIPRACSPVKLWIFWYEVEGSWCRHRVCQTWSSVAQFHIEISKKSVGWGDVQAVLYRNKGSIIESLVNEAYVWLMKIPSVWSDCG